MLLKLLRQWGNSFQKWTLRY